MCSSHLNSFILPREIWTHLCSPSEAELAILILRWDRRCFGPKIYSPNSPQVKLIILSQRNFSILFTSTKYLDHWNHDHLFEHYKIALQIHWERTVPNSKTRITWTVLTGATTKMVSTCKTKRDNEIINMLAFHTGSNKRSGRKPTSILVSAITATWLANLFSWKEKGFIHFTRK